LRSGEADRRNDPALLVEQAHGDAPHAEVGLLKGGGIAPVADLLEFRPKLVGIANRCHAEFPQRRFQDPLDLGLQHVGEQRFLRGSGVKRETTPWFHGQSERARALDTLEADGRVPLFADHG